MKKNIVFGLLVLGSAVSLSFFQNCSKIATADLEKTDLGLNAFAESAPVVSNDTMAAIATIDEATGQVEIVPEVKVAEEPKQQQSAEQSAAEPEVVAEAPVKGREEKLPESKSVDEVVKEEKEEVDTSSETEAIAACLDKYKNKRTSLTGSMFSDLHGKYRIVSDQVSEIRDSRGKLLVRPQTDRSLVDKISNFHGKLILCNADVELIENVHGKLVLINSQVKEITGHKGAVKSINSTILKFDGKFKIVAF